MEKEQFVNITEIWQPTDEGDGEAFEFVKDRYLKRVVILANDEPIYIDKEFAVKKSKITKEMKDNLKKNLEYTLIKNK